MGFGGGNVSMLLRAAVDYAWARGCVMFAATGNRNIPFIYWPARHLHVAAVGALSPCRERKSIASCDGEFWWGSNFGPGLDFLAPGVQVMTTDIRGAGGYGAQDYVALFNGTSAATPHAAGVAALVLSIAPDLPNHVVLERLRMTCDDLGPEGVDPETGYGSLNARNAVRFLRYDPRLALWEEDRTTLELTAAVAGAAYERASEKVGARIRQERREHPDRMANTGGIVVGFIGVTVIGLGIVAGTKQA